MAPLNRREASQSSNLPHASNDSMPANAAEETSVEKSNDEDLGSKPNIGNFFVRETNAVIASNLYWDFWLQLEGTLLRNTPGLGINGYLRIDFNRCWSCMYFGMLFNNRDGWNSAAPRLCHSWISFSVSLLSTVLLISVLSHCRATCWRLCRILRAQHDRHKSGVPKFGQPQCVRQPPSNCRQYAICYGGHCSLSLLRSAESILGCSYTSAVELLVTAVNWYAFTRVYSASVKEASSSHLYHRGQPHSVLRRFPVIDCFSICCFCAQSSSCANLPRHYADKVCC